MCDNRLRSPHALRCACARCALTRARAAGGSQFALAWLGTASLQKGPLWWASHHRHHHRTADTRADAHSPVVHGFWWSHCGWFLLTNRHAAPLLRAVPDLAALPELRFLERFYLLPPAALAACLYAWGGEQAVAYGFIVATVLCWHATYAINSVAHLLGGRRFVCEFNGSCTARNNLCAPSLQQGLCAALADAPAALAQRSCAADARRRMAQQPSPLPELNEKRFLLVGNRPHLLRPQDALVDRPDLGFQTGSKVNS